MIKKISFTIIIILVSFTYYSCGPEPEKEPNGKAVWIEDFFQALSQYPDVYAASYWHENFDDTEFRLDSSGEATEAYRTSIAGEEYLTQCIFENQNLIAVEGAKYIAAFPDLCGEEDCVSEDRITAYENLVNKNLAWVYFSNNWTNGISFPEEEVAVITGMNRIPFIRMMPRSDFEIEGIDPVWDLRDILSGDYDAELLVWFTQAAQVDSPLLVEFGTEMNGSWFSWNGLYYGAANTDIYGDSDYPDGPEIFRDAYRHIIDLSRTAGSDNITWFFHFDVSSDPEEDWNDPVLYYPGDNYIDWLGVSAYGMYSPEEVSDELQPAFLLEKAHDKFIQISLSKPYAVLEFGVTEF